jgi:hypothetical protein
MGVIALTREIPQFFREPVTLQLAEEDIRRNIERREDAFLELVRPDIFDRPESPYRKLLRHAGCEYADLGLHVHRCGIEQTLRRLAREGVYLTIEEFKGKKPVIRGNFLFCFTRTPGASRAIPGVPLAKQQRHPQPPDSVVRLPGSTPC